MGLFIVILYFMLTSTYAQPYITYASGIFNLFDYVQYSSFVLNQQKSYSKTLTFPGTFANSPKVILFSKHYDMDQANNEFTINITSYSQTECTFFIASTWLSTKRTFSYVFYWVAIDDKRIEVIDCFNYNFTNKGSQDISFPHTNINALQGFITTTSLGYLGAINYSLAISSITIDNVIVSFKTSNTNLLSVGFQIVLGIPEAFTFSDLYSQKISPSITYVSGNLPIPTGNELFVALSAMYYDNAKNIRLNQTVTLTTTTVNYKIFCWVDSYLTILSHQRVWMNKQNTKTYSPFLFKKMRVSRLFQFGVENYRWKLQISELNKQFSAAATQTFLIDKSIQILTLKYSYQCIPNGKAQGTVLKCASCATQTFNYNCYDDINFINFFIQLFQPDQIYEYVTFVVTNQGFLITETVMNQNITTYKIVEFKISV